MYDGSGVMYQDPDYTACVAASSQMMLNMIYGQTAEDFGLREIGQNGLFVPPDGPALTWRPSVSHPLMERIMAYTRLHMTMLTSSAGTDPHGWRNALNYFGWGSIGAGVYADRAYLSFDAAAKATVHAVAVYHKPVGILGWYGGHAQFITGYTVTGADPQTGSMAFTVTGVYLTDPLISQAMRNKLLSYKTWRDSLPRIAFKQYWQKDSPYRDPIDGNVGRTEWYGHWVAIVPVV